MSKLSHNKIATHGEVVAHFRDGMKLLSGGFGSAGFPTMLYEWLYATGCKDLDIITSGVSPPDKLFQLGFAGLVHDRRIKRLTLTHAANNPEVGRLRIEGLMEVEAVPQGTFVERIRAGGAGLGGVLTPTGIGTSVAEGKEILTINGKEYLLELPIRAEVAILRAEKADKMGNLMFQHTSRNYNTVIPTAADIVIVEVPETGIVAVGEMADNEVMVPGIFVDMIVPIPKGEAFYERGKA
jgi:acetate CoA/acetoacetate CoA-transferase alpha subunit